MYLKLKLQENKVFKENIKPMNPIDINDISIQIKLLDTGNLLARATVILFGIWEEHGWRVMRSKKMHPQFGEEIWIQSPSFKTSVKWQELVFINNRKLWEQVQEKIYDAYFMARNKRAGQDSVVDETEKEPVFNSEEVNPEDIPF
jgi:hypothetical protein